MGITFTMIILKSGKEEFSKHDSIYSERVCMLSHVCVHLGGGGRGWKRSMSLCVCVCACMCVCA